MTTFKSTKLPQSYDEAELLLHDAKDHDGVEVAILSKTISLARGGNYRDISIVYGGYGDKIYVELVTWKKSGQVTISLPVEYDKEMIQIINCVTPDGVYVEYDATLNMDGIKITLDGTMVSFPA